MHKNISTKSNIEYNASNNIIFHMNKLLLSSLVAINCFSIGSASDAPSESVEQLSRTGSNKLETTMSEDTQATTASVASKLATPKRTMKLDDEIAKGSPDNLFDRRISDSTDTTVFDVMDDVTSKKQSSVVRTRSDLGQATRLCSVDDGEASTEQDSSTQMTQTQEESPADTGGIDADLATLPADTSTEETSTKNAKRRHKRGRSMAFAADEIESLHQVPTATESEVPVMDQIASGTLVCPEAHDDN